MLTSSIGPWYTFFHFSGRVADRTHALADVGRREALSLHSELGYFISLGRGWARTQTPTTRNCTVELPTFAVIAGVSPVRVQWKSLALKETPRWSDLLSRQVSMPLNPIRQERFFQTSITLVASAGSEMNIDLLQYFNKYVPQIEARASNWGTSHTTSCVGGGVGSVKIVRPKMARK